MRIGVALGHSSWILCAACSSAGKDAVDASPDAIVAEAVGEQSHRVTRRAHAHHVHVLGDHLRRGSVSMNRTKTRMTKGGDGEPW